MPPDDVLGEQAPAISVATLQGMADKVILGGPHEGEKLGEERIAKIEEGVREAVGEVFKAAVGAGSSFQVRALSRAERSTLVYLTRPAYPGAAERIRDLWRRLSRRQLVPGVAPRDQRGAPSLPLFRAAPRTCADSSERAVP